jgi:3-hydroxyacyl-CoA dehydrogenase/enoyl-CoA hydratase/3-hydroxybutyryl-CoA epimerase
VRGFYRYVGGNKKGVDTSVRSARRSPERRVACGGVIQRLVLVMLNEAARAFGEGVVRSPRDGDIAALFGFGFPPFRGGPLRHADDLGAARLVGELERLEERHGARFAPSEVLQDLARRGAKFYP